jgi:AraC-like DNA-binding protein
MYILPMVVESRMLVRHALDSPLGSASLAAYIKSNTGLPPEKMRILGHFALVYLISGSGRFLDTLGNDTPLVAGNLILLFPDIGHTYGPARGQTWDEIYIVFNGPVFELWRKNGLLDQKRPVRSLAPIDFWARRIEETVDRRGLFGQSVSEACRLQQLLSDILDYENRQTNDADQMWLALAMAELQEDTNHDAVDWDQMAGRFGMTYAGFRKKFTRLAGVPPARFLTRQVIARASRLMQEKGLNNKQLAEACGFCDEFHFSRRFKQVTGIAPSEFRQYHRSVNKAGG